MPFKDPEKNREYQREYYRKRDSDKIKQKRRIWYKNKIEDQLLRRAKTRAKKKGLEFDLLLEDIVIPQICPVLGIPIFYEQNGMRSYNSPSMDRIDNSKGYTKDNIQIISWRANDIKNDASLEEIKKVYTYMVRNISV